MKSAEPETPPTVLHLVTDLRRGGTQQVLLERVRRPGPVRHAVLCFSTRTGGSRMADVPDLSAAFRKTGASIHALGLNTPREALVAALDGRLARCVDGILAATRPFVLHSTLFQVHLLGAWMSRRTGIPHLASKEGIDDWMNPLHRRLEARALRGAVRVVAVSRATANAARKLGVEPGRIEIIPNGIDPAHPGDWTVPAPATEDRESVVVRLAVDGVPRPSVLHLVGVGRLDRVKGWDDLLAAVALLRDRHPGVQCDLLGSGAEAERRRLRQRADALGLTGRVRIRADAPPSPPVPEDPAPRPILVVPSREEGFGLVLLEGMARGLPIVATTAGGIPEVARHGIEAILVPPRDPRALAEAIARLHATPALADALVEAGRARAAAFPVAAMVDAYHRLYAELLVQPHSRRPEASGTSKP